MRTATHPPRVYVADAGVQQGPLTDRPGPDLGHLCLDAATAAVRTEEARLAIEAVYLGTMGVRRGRPGGGIDPSHIPALVRRDLALPDVRDLHTVTSTSESGAVVFAQAVADLRAGRYRTALVLAGEQMFAAVPTASDDEAKAERRRQAADIAGFIRGVVDLDERRLYGLSMLQVGDLLMDHLVHRSGLAPARWHEILAAVTLDKYALAHGHRGTFVARRETGRPALDRARYLDDQANPAVTRWFRRETVCPNGNGASAVLLTTDPALLPAQGPHLAVLGIGRGEADVSLRHRSGDFGQPAAVQGAFAGLVRDAGVDPAFLRSSPLVCGLLHDPFPAIELAFLLAIAGDAGWPWALERYLDAWGHPLGGLCAGGHALGNSGLMQIAHAWHLAASDARYLAAAPARQDWLHHRRPGLYLTSSVGAALTRVVMTLLGDVADPRVQGVLAGTGTGNGTAEIAGRAGARPPPRPATTDGGLGGLAPDEAVVLAATAAEPGFQPPAGAGPWIHLLALPDAAGLRLALGATPTPAGHAVRIDRGAEPWRIVPDSARQVAPAAADPALDASVARWLHALQAGRLAERWGAPEMAS